MTAVPEDFVPGLEGVVAFTTEIAEPDKDGGALRYRGVDIEDLVRDRVTFGDVWSLLVDGRFGEGLPPAEPFPLPIHTGDVRVDVQAGLAMLAPIWGYAPLLDIDDETAREQLARASVMALSYVAQSARGIYQPAVPQRVIDECATVTERFMTRWQGDPDPRHVEAIDAYWVSAAEHGMNASTFTARVIASTGADVAAALSGAVGPILGQNYGARLYDRLVTTMRDALLFTIVYVTVVWSLLAVGAAGVLFAGDDIGDLAAFAALASRCPGLALADGGTGIRHDPKRMDRYERVEVVLR